MTEFATALGALTAARQTGRPIDIVNAREAFSDFTDPRRNLGQLPDDAPIVLFPIRIETRFTGGQEGAELLVRIYPDDCSIDTFEPQLSVNELANVKLYWQNYWRAGGVEGDQRAAWRNLVAAHGSGRAGWLVDGYQPTNLSGVPTKVAATDEILVIPTSAMPATADVTALSTYWTASWVAADDGATQAATQAAALAALTSAVGAARVDGLLAANVPFDLTDAPVAPLTRHDVAVQVAFVEFPPDPPTSQSSWTQAPQVRRFPERFVVVGYTGATQDFEAIGGEVTLPLYVGPDPSADPVADPDSVIHPDNGDLFVPDQLSWMVDFDAAVAAGMALRIPLTPAQARAGFDRLLVVGIEMGTADGSGVAVLSEILDHHRTGRAGLGVLAQGTTTHNSTGVGTGYSKVDDPDESFDDRRDAPLFVVTPDEWAKSDGQWLAEALGVDPALLARVHGAGGEDQLRARAMQRAVWPATLGYWMDKMMAPAFGDATVAGVRDFATRYVRGCGSLPAIRIGGQPYGVLPTTAFSRIGWLQPGRHERTANVLPALHQVLTSVGKDWATMSTTAAHVGSSGDPHQILLDVIGLNPSSVEFYSRYAESLDQLVNVESFFQLSGKFYAQLQALNLQGEAAGLLIQLGYTGVEPDLLKHFFFSDANQLATVIDDRPLSETDGIRAYTDDGRNYLTWLADAARASLDQVVAEQGFTGGTSPAAVLYLMLRHAVMLGYYDTSYDLHRTTGALSPLELAATKREAPFIHVADAAATESRFGLLYKAEPLITSSPTMIVGDYIAANLAALLADEALGQQLASLDILANTPTAALERAFAEHVDICSYRYDAWLLGLVDYQLQAMRAATTQANKPAAITYLGAYGWVENLRRSTATLTPVELPPELQDPTGSLPPVLSDSSNGGFVQAPSMTHARTAAVLRSGYLANASNENPSTMAVNLSSDRVRVALAVLEGIRGGQSIGALLGYQFELGLHDAYSLAEVDKFIYPLRKAFPLVADALATTATDPGVPIEAIEARNVMDGRKLAEHITGGAPADYPFGLTTLPAATSTEAAAINAQTSALLDAYDSIADVALAEGVHQAVQGNFARIGATLDAYSSGTFPPQPEVVSTPNGGQGLTHRVGLHLRAGLPAPAIPTPAATAEPAIDDWLGRTLPPLNTVGCVVTWTDPVTAAAREQVVTLADLGFAPADTLDVVLPDSAQAMAQLDDRVLGFVLSAATPRPDAVLTIEYLHAPAGGLSIFEVSGLIRTARELLSRSRPLRATDVMLGKAAALAPAAAATVVRARIADPLADLDLLGIDIAAFLAILDPLVGDPVGQRATMLAGVDGYLDTAVALLSRSARFRLTGSGWGFAIGWRQSAYAALIAQVRTLLDRLAGKLAAFDAAITNDDALPATTPEADRLTALQQAELLVSTTLIPPTTAAALRLSLNGVRNTFVTRSDAFSTLLSTAPNTFAGALAALTALLPVTDIDRAPFDVTALGDSAVTFVADLYRCLSAVQTAAAARSTATQQQLNSFDSAPTSDAQIDALEAAAKALLGPDFSIVPEFQLPPGAADDWANAVAESTGGALLNYLTTTLDIDFPVNEWLIGVARVRPMMKAWETLTALVDALRGPADVPELLAMQLPVEVNAPWVAMAFPSAYVLDSDHLCYTACYSTPFDKTASQCALLIDEWTEAIPATSLDTGMSFNYDRPNNEAPQSILVVTPATGTGSWQWDDVLAALNETLDLAKIRTVDPTAVDATPYAMLVPATIVAATMYGISISTSLDAANGAQRFFEERA
jgi:hypothetical protein